MSAAPPASGPTAAAGVPEPDAAPPADRPADGPAGQRPGGRDRWLDTALSALLGLLVAGSLVLTGRLWLTTPYLTPPPVQPAAYVAADASGRATPADLVAPLRIVLHSPSGGVRGLADPADPVFKAIWTASRRVLSQVGPDVVAAGRPSDVASLAAAAGSGPSVELWFGARLPWLDLRAILTEGSGSGGPRVDRILVVPGAAATEVFLAAGASVRELSLPARAARSLRAEIDALPGAGDPLRPLASGIGKVRVLPGVFVPLGVPPQVGARLEPLSVAALVDASFRDPSVVRAAIESNGSHFFTDGEDWLRVARDGLVRWAAPEAAAPVKGGLSAALAEAARFVDHRGGWPPSATLVGAGSGAGTGPSGGGSGTSPAVYRLSFAVRYRGWEVVGGPPALSVTVGEAGVTSYLRRVPTATGAKPGSSGITAELGLQSLAAAWPSGVAPSARLVADVFACYVYRGRQLLPAWDYQLADGSQVAVDALSGRVIGLVSAPA